MSLFRWTAPLLKLAGRCYAQDEFETLADHLRPYVPPGALLADLGGGTGDLGSGIAQALAARLVIIDSTPQVLRRVDPSPLVSVSLAQAEDLPFPDAYFDGLLCSDAFHHMRDQEAVSREMARVVRPGGGILMLELEPGRVLPRLERMLGEPAAFMTMEDLRTMLSRHGISGKCSPHTRGYLFVGHVDGTRRACT